jgi:hypothetical protein
MPSAEGKTEGNVVISIPVHGDKAGRHRAVVEHGDGRWTIALATPGEKDAKAEHTFTLDEARAWTEQAFAGNPEARKTPGLALIISAGFLLMLVATGAIKVEAAAT